MADLSFNRQRRVDDVSKRGQRRWNNVEEGRGRPHATMPGRERGDGTAVVIPCHVAFAGRQRGADISKSRATPPPKRGSKKIWGQLWGHVIFSIMKKSFMFSMLLAYFVFPRPKQAFQEVRRSPQSLEQRGLFLFVMSGMRGRPQAAAPDCQAVCQLWTEGSVLCV